MGMHVKVIGGGPAGLYFAWLMKRSDPTRTVRVIEQNPAGATYGFGVVLTGRALAFLKESDAAAIGRLAARMETWNEQHIVHRGSRVRIDGGGISAISRLSMLEWLRQLCAEADVEVEHGRRHDAALDPTDCDVLVAADGSHSAIRDRFALEFDTRVTDLQNYYCWYGSEIPFPAHTIDFRPSRHGLFIGHYYRYAPDRSTFVPEVEPETWLASGLAGMSDPERKALVEEVFAGPLGGTSLITNRSVWRRWRLVTNGRWHHRNIVLIGDAQRTAHPSIASGTRLAMEDAIALWQAFQAEGEDLGAVFRRYERERRPVRDKLNVAAERSIAWYETVRARLHLSPIELAADYLMRTGVITPERLAAESPGFVQALQAARQGAAPDSGATAS